MAVEQFIKVKVSLKYIDYRVADTKDFKKIMTIKIAVLVAEVL
jgi:hypothetical protein